MCPISLYGYFFGSIFKLSPIITGETTDFISYVISCIPDFFQKMCRNCRLGSHGSECFSFKVDSHWKREEMSFLSELYLQAEIPIFLSLTILWRYCVPYQRQGNKTQPTYHSERGDEATSLKKKRKPTTVAKGGFVGSNPILVAKLQCLH